MNIGGGEAADQLVRMMLSGSEVAVRLSGSAIIQSAEPAKTAGAMSSLRWSYVLIPIGVVAAAGAGVGGALLVKRRKENADEEETEE